MISLFLLLLIVFRISSIIITGNEKTTTNPQSLNVKGTVPNILAKNGTYRITECKRMDKAAAINSQGFPKRPTVRREESSLKAFMALNISITTITDKDMVDAFFFPRVK